MVDRTRLTPCDEFRGEDDEDDALLRETFARATAYLASHTWCSAIRTCYVGEIAIGKVVAVLLFDIEPAHEGVDSTLWVVVGDLPPAYLVVDDSPNAACALEGYILEMRRWVAATYAGDAVDDLIPVETSGGAEPLEPTPEHAAQLAGRLDYLEREVLAEHRDDLEAGASGH
jgi:hypothetical protein